MNNSSLMIIWLSFHNYQKLIVQLQDILVRNFFFFNSEDIFLSTSIQLSKYNWEVEDRGKRYTNILILLLKTNEHSQTKLGQPTLKGLSEEEKVFRLQQNG